LSPKENRDVPPLDYPLVYQMKRDFPALHLSINGGVATLEEAHAHLAEGMDGVMIGRAAYHNPTDILCTADREIYGADDDSDPVLVVHQMLPYIEAHLTQGGKLNQVSRHMLGLFAGKPGARAWRRYLSEHATKPGAGPDTVLAALQHVTQAAA
jgi:tRNA-dihydrouridine synthase A